MSSNRSKRDQILESSSPLLTLSVIMSVIVTLMLVVFFTWLRFRRKGHGIKTGSPYDPLKEIESPGSLSDELILKCGITGYSGRYYTGFVSGNASPPEVAMPEAVLAGLSGLPRTPQAPEENQSHLNINPVINAGSRRSSDTPHGDLSIEALVATHMRLVEQRERFITDAKHLGLRHLALQHLHTQQRYEKQILELKLRSLQNDR
jgi:hypothetical protein